LVNKEYAKENIIIEFLGLAVDEPVYFPTFIPALEGKKWVKFSGGLHHTLGLTAAGKRKYIANYTMSFCFCYLR
jgi:hypothetical protein